MKTRPLTNALTHAAGPMRSLLISRGPLYLISLGVGWGASALVFRALAEAHWQTVLWTFLARLFLVLAIACGSLAMSLMLLRSMPDDESERVGHLVCWAPGTMVAMAMAWITTLKSVELYLGFAVFVVLIGGLLSLERRFLMGRTSELHWPASARIAPLPSTHRGRHPSV